MTDDGSKVVRLTKDTARYIEKKKRPRETYDVTIRRLLGLPYRQPYRHKETTSL